MLYVVEENCNCFSGNTESKSGGDSEGLSNKQGLASADGLCHWFSQVPKMANRLQGG
jgi:hypothetical protein